jgi:hypothetical protein
MAQKMAQHQQLQLQPIIYSLYTSDLSRREFGYPFICYRNITQKSNEFFVKRFFNQKKEIPKFQEHQLIVEHSFSSHTLNFSQFSHSPGSFGPSSPALSHLEHGEETFSHNLGVTGN